MYLHDISKIITSTPIAQDGVYGDPAAHLEFLTKEVRFTEMIPLIILRHAYWSLEQEGSDAKF